MNCGRTRQATGLVCPADRCSWSPGKRQEASRVECIKNKVTLCVLHPCTLPKSMNSDVRRGPAARIWSVCESFPQLGCVQPPANLMAIKKFKVAFKYAFHNSWIQAGSFDFPVNADSNTFPPFCWLAGNLLHFPHLNGRKMGDRGKVAGKCWHPEHVEISARQRTMLKSWKLASLTFKSHECVCARLQVCIRHLSVILCEAFHFQLYTITCHTVNFQLIMKKKKKRT